MKRLLSLACLTTIAALHFPEAALAQRAQYDALVASHAKANGLPEALVHRVIVRESRYQPHLVGRGGTIGLMQIKLATARGLGYGGDAAGLRDPETNLTYGVKYLAGAYRAANGDHDRAVHYYASGYYAAAKRLRREHARNPADAHAQQIPGRQDTYPGCSEARSRAFSTRYGDPLAPVLQSSVEERCTPPGTRSHSGHVIGEVPGRAR